MSVLPPSLMNARFVSAVPAMPKRKPRLARYTLCVGFDTEWCASDKRLLSVQFSVRNGRGELRSGVFYPPVKRLSTELLLDLLDNFLQREGTLPAVHRRQRRVALVSHFAAAELSMLEDALGDLTIQRVGKAHHARIPAHSDEMGISWRVRLIDLYAFYKAPLAAIGKLVGLLKVEEDRQTLDDLLSSDRERFERYAARDAEIALVALEQLMSDVLANWQIDVLTKPSLSSVAADIFRRGFLSIPPVPMKEVPVPTRRQTAHGWSQRIVQQPIYAGSRDVREAALMAYAGGRVEAFVRGLVKGSVAELDVISLYPHAAISQPLPNRDTKWARVTTLEELATQEGFGMFRFRFPKGTKYPSLLVKIPGVARAMFPLQGDVSCTFAEIRAALRLRASVQIINAWGFVPGAAERDHDVGRYMRHWLKVKASTTRKTLAYENAKLFLNALIGKFAERHEANSILDLERVGRASGHCGIGQVVAGSQLLRDTLRGPEGVGGLWIPEWASLILGKSRALMAGIVANGALLVSTDSVIVRTPAAWDLPEVSDFAR